MTAVTLTFDAEAHLDGLTTRTHAGDVVDIVAPIDVEVSVSCAPADLKRALFHLEAVVADVRAAMRKEIDR